MSALMFAPELEPMRELRPPWAAPNPPRWGEIRRGVLYTGLEPDVLDFAFRELRPICALVGIGPAIFHGRPGADFVRWDPERMDENRDLLVREREWPHCWGDVVWAVVEWQLQPLYLRWELDELAQLYLGRPFAGPPPRDELAAWLDRLPEVREAPRTVLARPSAPFWQRRPPPPRPRGSEG